MDVELETDWAQVGAVVGELVLAAVSHLMPVDQRDLGVPRRALAEHSVAIALEADPGVALGELAGEHDQVVDAFDDAHEPLEIFLFHEFVADAVKDDDLAGGVGEVAFERLHAAMRGARADGVDVEAAFAEQAGGADHYGIADRERGDAEADDQRVGAAFGVGLGEHEAVGLDALAAPLPDGGRSERTALGDEGDGQSDEGADAAASALFAERAAPEDAACAAAGDLDDGAGRAAGAGDAQGLFGVDDLHDLVAVELDELLDGSAESPGDAVGRVAGSHDIGESGRLCGSLGLVEQAEFLGQDEQSGFEFGDEGWVGLRVGRRVGYGIGFGFGIGRVLLGSLLLRRGGLGLRGFGGLGLRGGGVRWLVAGQLPAAADGLGVACFVRLDKLCGLG